MAAFIGESSASVAHRQEGSFLPRRDVKLSAVPSRNSQRSKLRRGGRPGSTAPEVQVVSWNILCLQLCTAKLFQHSRLEDLDNEVRWQRVLEKLRDKVKDNAIICLQELSQDWCARLHPFFLQSDYYLLSTNYGHEHDGYMGVAVAFPTRLYELQGVDIKRVAEALPRYHSQAHELSVKNPWTSSRARQNRMISVRLRHRGSGTEDHDFVVSTYHMPCMFKDMKVMVIHAALAAQCAFEFAEDLPLILAGDFNFRPGSSPYELLTKGTLKEDHHDHPGKLEDWTLDSRLSVLRSSYFEKHQGGEPSFTNYAWTGDDTFIGTLDYIFVSKHAEVLQVDRLPTLDECTNHLPDGREPSDHLMIGARLLPHGKSPIQPVSNGRPTSSFSRPKAQDSTPTSTRTGSSEVRGRSFGASGSFLRRPSFSSMSKAAKGAM